MHIIKGFAPLDDHLHRGARVGIPVVGKIDPTAHIVGPHNEGTPLGHNPNRAPEGFHFTLFGLFEEGLHLFGHRLGVLQLGPHLGLHVQLDPPDGAGGERVVL